MICQSTSFAEAGSIRHRKQEGLQPSLVALFKCCKQPGSKDLMLCIDFIRNGVLIQSSKGVETLNKSLSHWR